MKTQKILNMKNLINRLVIGAVALLLLPSCSGFLDTVPSNATSKETAFLTIRDAGLAINGVYWGLKRDDYYGGPMQMMGDNRGDDLQPRNSSSGFSSDLYAFRYTSENLTNWGIWNRCYNTIMKVNEILWAWEAIPVVGANETAQKNDIKGQALALRAFSHFDVVRSYGYPFLKDNGQSLGAVLLDRTVTPAEALEIPRSTVSETYAFILADIQEALPLLFKPSTLTEAQAVANPAQDLPGKRGKVNYWGAKMLQARVYLYMGQWENAYNAAREVIAESPYRLASNSDYLTYWQTQGGSETIFELLVGIGAEDMDSNNNYSALYAQLWHASNGRGTLIPTQDWLDLMDEDPDDVRGKVISVGDGASGSTWLRKFPGTDGRDFSHNDPRIFRLAETYLIAAEAALASGRQAEADTYLDAIRKRANPENPTITCTLDDILKERRKEFIGEGHRFFDMMRLGKTITRKGGFHFATEIYEAPESYDWNYYKVVLPISRSTRLIYPLLAQNPGYTN